MIKAKQIWSAELLLRFSKAYRFENGWHSRGYLPHCDQSNILQSITLRLYDSLPQSLLQNLKEHEKNSNNPKIDLDFLMDKSYGQCFLAEPKVAKIVQDTLLFYHKKFYDLHEWVIMPNHLHFILRAFDQQSISSIIKRIKSYSARQSNIALSRNGSFWFEDYFDRFIRSEEHYNYLVNYIYNNPVKAGLCKSIEDWEYSSLWYYNKLYSKNAK